MRLLLVAVAAIAVKLAQGNNIPTKEMFEAKTFEEFQRALFDSQKPKTNLRRNLAGGGGTANFEFAYPSKPKIASDYGGAPGFYHGVASGSPLADAVIIWTRYTPATVSDVITLEYRIAEYEEDMPLNDHLDPSKNGKVKYGRVNVDSSKDFTLKIDITGLKSYTKYVYAFTDGSVVSPVGMTKTAPRADKNLKELTYAVYTCSNFPNGASFFVFLESLLWWIVESFCFFLYVHRLLSCIRCWCARHRSRLLGPHWRLHL
jgi:alkaline phosphatase D